LHVLIFRVVFVLFLILVLLGHILGLGARWCVRQGNGGGRSLLIIFVLLFRLWLFFVSFFFVGGISREDEARLVLTGTFVFERDVKRLSSLPSSSIAACPLHDM
jgi:hypothetical protein